MYCCTPVLLLMYCCCCIFVVRALMQQEHHYSCISTLLINISTAVLMYNRSTNRGTPTGDHMVQELLPHAHTHTPTHLTQ